MGFLPLAIAHYNREKLLLPLIVAHALMSKHVPLRIVLKGRFESFGDGLIFLRTSQRQGYGHRSRVRNTIINSWNHCARTSIFDFQSIHQLRCKFSIC